MEPLCPPVKPRQCTARWRAAATGHAVAVVVAAVAVAAAAAVVAPAVVAPAVAATTLGVFPAKLHPSPTRAFSAPLLAGRHRTVRGTEQSHRTAIRSSKDSSGALPK